MRSFALLFRAIVDGANTTFKEMIVSDDEIRKLLSDCPVGKTVELPGGRQVYRVSETSYIPIDGFDEDEE